jgi:mono/diheme cytochrome c family protein
MNRSNLITLVALLVIVAAMPLYAVQEQARLTTARQALRAQQVTEATPLYLENCAACHGASGAGVGAIPPLNVLTLADAGAEQLYETIAHAAHGTAMAAWHREDGSGLNAYQIERLVSLIRFADWSAVQAVAANQDLELPPPSVVPAGDEYLMLVAEHDPHRCAACHEEPVIHADQFGLDCGRCHATSAWQPALLTRHTFDLTHGGAGPVACQTCHTVAYTAHVCTECHDHEPEAIEAVHLAEDIPEYGDCARCHPTGAAGEADRLRQEGLIQAGVAVPATQEMIERHTPAANVPAPGATGTGNPAAAGGGGTETGDSVTPGGRR